MNRLTIALILAAILISLGAAAFGYTLLQMRQARNDNRAAICDLRDASIDILVLARATPTREIGFYELSIARLHRIACP